MKEFVLKNGLLALFGAGAVAVAAPAAAETLTNADVIALLEVGLGDEAVIAKIEASDAEFETDTATLIALRQHGVSSSVIAAMVKRESAIVDFDDTSPDPTVPHTPGFYMLVEGSGEPSMMKIDPIASTQIKTGGILGYALTGGIASASVKAVIPGENAQTTTSSRRPVFYVFFDGPGEAQSAVFSSGFGNFIQSPNEISLIDLMEKKNRREARVGSLNIAGSKAGVMDKDQVPFSYEQVTETTYKITIDTDLEEGEYGFIFALVGGAGPGASGGVAGARVFDFSVQ